MNLIGEHIDYEGYGVLPMAIVLDTVVCIRRGGDAIHLCNLDPKYSEQRFSVDPEQEINVENHSWGNYFLCAYKGVYEFLKNSGDKSGISSPPSPIGLEIMVHGRVPTGGGLSSSAAIVCASALAILGVHGIHITKEDLAEFTAKAEQYVGVTSGGMDQAISIMGRLGIAQHIQFNPVRGVDVALPAEATFVIANSLAVSNKAEGAEGRYNLRVVECRLAAAVMAVLLGKQQAQALEYKTLKDIERLLSENSLPEGSMNDNPGLKAAMELLHRNPYDTPEIEGLLGATLHDIFKGDHSALRVIAKFSSFKLQQRAMHVYSEQKRVTEFVDICSDREMEADVKLDKIGNLMDDSQTSCRDLYECSCPELDSLTSIAKASGALGSRLTGAGWGGCTVSLIRSHEVDPFISKVIESYYRPLIASGKLKESDIGSVIFASKPSSGGGLLNFKI